MALGLRDTGKNSQIYRCVIIRLRKLASILIVFIVFQSKMNVNLHQMPFQSLSYDHIIFPLKCINVMKDINRGSNIKPSLHFFNWTQLFLVYFNCWWIPLANVYLKCLHWCARGILSIATLFCTIFVRILYPYSLQK